jgi:polyisoprenoid-binding protein YceI
VTIPPGTYALGPGDGTLTVRTGRTGAASKAGHNLLIEVTAWRATLTVGDGGGEVELTADPRSLRVRDGTGGATTLDEADKAGIAQTIDDEVLRGAAIAFRSTSVEPVDGGDGLRVHGDLALGDARAPVAFALAAGGGRLTGSARLRQSDWGITPYTALFGTLRVADEVEVAVAARLTEPIGRTDHVG